MREKRGIDKLSGWVLVWHCCVLCAAKIGQRTWRRTVGEINRACRGIRVGSKSEMACSGVYIGR